MFLDAWAVHYMSARSVEVERTIVRATTLRKMSVAKRTEAPDFHVSQVALVAHHDTAGG